MASLQEAVVKGLAADRGLFMPMTIKPLPQEFYDTIDTLSFQEIAYRVADAFFGEDIPADTLKQIVYDTLSFDVPLVKVADNIYSLELFYGPTLAFKDVGGRFMARLLGYFIKKEGQKDVNVLVATSGDTGSAVANGFLGVEGIHVYVLYPKGKVSEIQEKQFTTLGQNITALEVDGTFDDCQALVKAAFMDKELNEHLSLTSANSINVARFLPQAFYYFYAYAQLKRAGKADNAVICVPSGNFGNITAGLFGKKMGLPVKRFIAANNRNDIFYQYLQTGKYNPRPSVATIANAMDVGDPSNLLGDACRPGCLADATDVCQIEELVRLGELTKRAWEKDVQVMVEGPGHVPMDQIAANMKVQQTICMGAPFYVLGPLVTDIAPGYDHITAAIGGAIAAMSGAAFLCYVTPAEHLALPNLDDVKQGIIASKIAAHAADIAKGVRGARDIDDKMGDARRVLDWDAQWECALDPETAKAIRADRAPEHEDTCSMCGKFCAVRSMNKALNGEHIDIL